MFRIKICGITNVEDAVAVAKAGADAIGLNFYGGSKRCVSVPKAEMIVRALPRDVEKVGLFVNADPEYVRETAARLVLRYIQLHGDEPPDYARIMLSKCWIRALRLSDAGLKPISGFLSACGDAGCRPYAVLIDAHVKGQYGGTGQVADWEVLKTYRTDIKFGNTFPPLVLAGGLTPENVADAIRTVRPAAVDTASGVESSPGRKDPAKVEAFVRAARTAFHELA